MILYAAAVRNIQKYSQMVITNKCLWHGTRLNNCSFWLLNFVTMRVFFQWFICIFGIFMHFSPWADTEPGISLRSSHTSSVSIVVFAVFSFFKYSHFRGIMEKKAAFACTSDNMHKAFAFETGPHCASYSVDSLCPGLHIIKFNRFSVHSLRSLCACYMF